MVALGARAARQNKKLSMQLPDKQLRLLHHTLGLCPDQRRPYRNHFVAGTGHDDMPDLEALEAAGLMHRRPTPKFCEPGDVVFHATDKGISTALALLASPRKRSRYDDFLDADSGMSFGEFLCGSRIPCIEFDCKPTGQRMYRMYRETRSCGQIERDVQGHWSSTRKEAKASYKKALAQKMRLTSRAASSGHTDS